MGAAVSTNIVKQTNESIVNSIAEAVIKSQSSCAASSQQDQNMTIGIIGGNATVGNIGQKATSKVSAECIQKSANSSKMQADIAASLKSTIQQTAQANPTMFNANVATNTSNSINKSITNISNKFNIDSIKSCIASIAQKQAMVIGQIIGNAAVGTIGQELSADVVAKCIQDESNVVEDIKTLQTAISSETKQDAFSGIPTGAIIAIVIACVICLGILAYILPSLM